MLTEEQRRAGINNNPTICSVSNVVFVVFLVVVVSKIAGALDNCVLN